MYLTAYRVEIYHKLQVKSVSRARTAGMNDNEQIDEVLASVARCYITPCKLMSSLKHFPGKRGSDVCLSHHEI